MLAAHFIPSAALFLGPLHGGKGIGREILVYIMGRKREKREVNGRGRVKGMGIHLGYWRNAAVVGDRRPCAKLTTN